MPAVARIADPTTTGHGCDVITTVISGSTTVFANYIGVEHKGDPTQIHTLPCGNSCCPHQAKINVGSGTVFADGIAIARVGDSTDSGAIIAGSSNVNAGG
jgi:uncharacterized Zn-binding protein involved in type VI secretion